MSIQNQEMDNISVLVVDDEATIRRLIRRNLESQSTQIIEASTGLDGITALYKNHIDLIILDLKLPDFNGWGILTLLRLSEKFQNIPVIVVSVESKDASLADWLKPNDYIQKPFDIGELISRVRRITGVKIP